MERLRRPLGYAVVLATLPYLALKLHWISGGTAGMADPAYFAVPEYRIGNLVTVGMDTLVAALGLALTHRWGLRIPAWLLVFPMWVATGFLAPIAVGTVFPTGASEPSAQPEPLHGWVFTLVYAGFAVQGVLLLTAFVWYATTRWRDLFDDCGDAAPAGPTRQLQRLVGLAGGGLAGLVGVLQIAWAAGLTAGLPAHLVAGTGGTTTPFGLYGGFALAAALGLAMLLTGTPRLRPRTPVALAWTGSGAMFAWGAWHLATMAALPALAAPVLQLVTTVQVLGGALVAVVAAFHLAEREYRHH